MKHHSQTKTNEEESASKVLPIEQLTEVQKQQLRMAIGSGLWEQLQRGDSLSASTLKLLECKMRHHKLLSEKEAENWADFSKGFELFRHSTKTAFP